MSTCQAVDYWHLAGTTYRLACELPAGHDNGGNEPEETVDHFRRALIDGRLQFSVTSVRRDLAGKDLACWCPPGAPCHADVLLLLANGVGA